MTQRKRNDDELPELSGDDDASSSSATAAAAEAAEASASTSLASALDQLAKLQAESEELRATLVRRQADFENFRKRIDRERVEDSRRHVSRVIESLLPVLDGFERALAAHAAPAYEDYRKGFELIYRQLWDALQRLGLERLDPVGKRFDPHVHQALERVESADHADGTVLDVLQPGYSFHGRLLRPAVVRVAVHPAQASAGADPPHRLN